MNTPLGGGALLGLSKTERQKPRGQIGHAENSLFLEEHYEQWRVNPSSVDANWQAFFEGFELGSQLEPDLDSENTSNGKALKTDSNDPIPALPVVDPMRQGRLSHLLFAYRMLGHYIANLDPLGFNKHELPELELHNFKFTEEDLDQEFNAGTAGGGGVAALCVRAAAVLPPAAAARESRGRQRPAVHGAAGGARGAVGGGGGD